ncbi:MAG: hypothetical protein ACHBN1_15975 [Heteroscytonema crispum UTEX LB 1556]
MQYLVNPSDENIRQGAFVLVFYITLISPVNAQTADIKPESPRFGGSFTTQGAGYEEPYFSIEGFVPIIQNPGNSLTFLEGRLLWLTDSTMGGNLVLGQRAGKSGDEILGGYIAYDIRDTGNSVRMRANWY